VFKEVIINIDLEFFSFIAVNESITWINTSASILRANSMVPTEAKMLRGVSN